ncbi:MAG TPA: sulfate ABC transporter permease subunit CysW [Xanthomonadaceae bacterium]|jgi:sulfate transport system permease protein|nr:sulfate ABC transporter permease subunit CysW [Xanthomonadaceae bacterium]
MAGMIDPGVLQRKALQDPAWLRWTLIATCMAALAGIVLLPLLVVAFEALHQGWSVYATAVLDADTRAAIRLTLLVAAISVAVNATFGIAAAWAITKFRFPGKRLLLTLIDLPFSVSPVVSGLVFVLLFGAQGWLGPWLREHGIHIIFATPGIVLATIFVTFPFVARELIPLMQQQGSAQEEAASSLGAGGWMVFRRVTLPNIRWALLYGLLLCSARAMGEFGAVSVVSGHIRGLTNTLPLQVEILYNEYSYTAAFAVATLLVLLALLTLVLKLWLEWRHADALSRRRAGH